MTGAEIATIISGAHDNRREEMHRLMAEYDKAMNDRIRTYQAMCPHDRTRPTDNGLGWIGTECVWCGKQLTNEYVDDTEGR
jgi:hypothetical protein